MTRKPHTELHLPPLAPDDALLVVNVMERLISAIWRAHGPQMVQKLQCFDQPPPVPVAHTGPPAPDNPFDADPIGPDYDDDIPF